MKVFTAMLLGLLTQCAVTFALIVITQVKKKHAALRGTKYTLEIKKAVVPYITFIAFSEILPSLPSISLPSNTLHHIGVVISLFIHVP